MNGAGVRGRGRGAALRLIVVVMLVGLMPAGAMAMPAPEDRGGSQSSARALALQDPLAPIDAQDWVDMADLTWDDYTQIRPQEWHDDSVHGSVQQFRGAVVLADFTDQPFLITQEAETHPFGNPQPGWEPVAQEDVNQWMHEYYSTPNEFNGGQTIHAYWMENTYGRLGVSMSTYGPYRLPGKLHEYGLSGFGRPVGNQANSVCPAGDTCNRNLRTDSRAAWEAEQGPDITAEYDFIFYVSAGHDESSTWQEFGEMLFLDREDVPDALGPPRNPDGSPARNAAGNIITNWAGTRYVPWTSWRAATNHWPNATFSIPRSSTQAESSGQSVFAHEFSHILGLPDNYNNPFADNIRNYSGYWEMMSRGTFNGPGGTHNRWQVPNQGGSGLGPHHTVRHKRALGIYEPGELVMLQRDDLADQGIAVARIKARSDVPDGEPVGINVAFGTTTANGQNLRTCAALGHVGADSFWCHGNNNYHNYAVEVVDRVGNDSFVPGHGVLIALTRNTNTQPNVWLIDPNPEDIGMVDFYRPDGTPVMVVRGDPRQLNNATYHAGTNSGSDYEFVDEHNRIHFYIIDTHRDERGVLYYDIGIRRLDGAGDFDRGVSLGEARKVGRTPGRIASCVVPLNNTGEAGEGLFDSDVYRLTATSQTPGWEAHLPNELTAARAGESVEVLANAVWTPTAPTRGTITITATSEADPTQSATATCDVHVRDTTPATTHGSIG